MTNNRTFQASGDRDALDAGNIHPWLVIPRTNLEASILRHPDIKEGLIWGNPSIGHPEPNIGFHVVEVLKNIDELVFDPISKERLRLAAITHDTFKYKEHRIDKKNCHGLLARKFMENYSNDSFLLDLLEWHDEAYRAWRIGFYDNNFVLSEKKIQQLITRFGEKLHEYHQFFICDSKMMDKRKQPVQWFGDKVRVVI